jgi:uncharacterized protein (TIGR03435 family)
MLNVLRKAVRCIYILLALCIVFEQASFCSQSATETLPPAKQMKSEQPPRFEVASIRIIDDFDKLPENQKGPYFSPPGAGQFVVRNETLGGLIGFAFEVGFLRHPIIGNPKLDESTRFAIMAKPAGDQGLSYEQIRPLLQQLLQDRFHLTFHRKTKNVKGYALVIAKGGPKLTPAKIPAADALSGAKEIVAPSASMDMLTELLTHQIGEVVVDRTGLKGNYDIKLEYAPYMQIAATDSPSESIFTALKEKLGLKLERQMVPVEAFVIDHADRVPTEN